MNHGPYLNLAQRLDSLPNGFPPTEDGIELKILAKLFTPEEASLAASLRLSLEAPEQIAGRLGVDAQDTRTMLKSMARRGLISIGRIDGGLGYGLMPFVVGIYEMQVSHLDTEFAQLFEDYYQRSFGKMLSIQPAVHRVIPVGESVRTDIAIQPYENATEIVKKAQAWGVLDCICRKQKALIGDPCEHPVDICMALSQQPGAYDGNPVVHALTLEEALATLQRAAQAGLVHSVSNSLHGQSYICNCCTCCCGILRAYKEFGRASAFVKSDYYMKVDEQKCIGCATCINRCQFDALVLQNGIMTVNKNCIGCGVCAMDCSEDALQLVNRNPKELSKPPKSDRNWYIKRMLSRLTIPWRLIK